jgi:hypothetical protein
MMRKSYSVSMGVAPPIYDNSAVHGLANETGKLLTQMTQVCRRSIEKCIGCRFVD